MRFTGVGKQAVASRGLDAARPLSLRACVFPRMNLGVSVLFKTCLTDMAFTPGTGNGSFMKEQGIAREGCLACS